MIGALATDGRRLRRLVALEDFVTFDDLEPVSEHAGAPAAAQL